MNATGFKVLMLSAAVALAGCQGNDSEISTTPGTSSATQLSAALAAVGEAQKDDQWFKSGVAEVTTAASAAVKTGAGAAKNIILFVGDGMGVSTVTAARILQGQNQGLSGEEHNLSFDKFPYAGLAKTYNTNQQTPDSAGTMTAMMSGVKTKAGVIGVAEAVTRGDCASSQGTEVFSALELAEIAGKATGIVSTARITHATPAAAYAKSPERNWEDISDMPAAAVTTGCKDIADQLVNFESMLEARLVAAGADATVAANAIDGIEVAMGGGRRHFLPKDAAFNSADAASSVEGDRTDTRDLTAEWKTAYPAGSYVIGQADFDAVDSAATDKLLGLFNESHMRYEADRGNDTLGEPSLSKMTAKAIEILKKDQDGFFLTVESGRIDHGHHAGSAYNALTDADEFARAVQAAVDATNPDETLIIVTADHSHVFTIAGYPTRGNPILGKVVGNDSSGQAESAPAKASDGNPYTTLGYTNGLGFAALGGETNADARYSYDPDGDGNTWEQGRKDISSFDTTAPGYHQEAMVPLSSETHSGEDVSVYAQGPGASLVNGTNEQSVIFHIMNRAGNLLELAQSAVSLP